jgi:Cytidine deaminase
MRRPQRQQQQQLAAAIHDPHDYENYQDLQDIQLAHEYRLKLKHSPRQSSFCVVAVIFYELLRPDIADADAATKGERLFVVGTNDEPCYIGGAICAERAALVQLRFLPIKKITKIVISTDAHHPVYPGMLCREFMSSHMYIDPKEVPIVTAGCVCQRDGCGLVCLLDAAGTAVAHHVSSTPGADAGTRTGASCSIKDKMGECSFNGNGSSSSRKVLHEWEYVKTYLTDLYPHPSPYTRLTALESVELGMEFSKKRGCLSYNSPGLSQEAKELILVAVQVARDSSKDRLDLHPIQYAAAVKFDNGDVYTASQRKTLEYGCSVDAITQLASIMMASSSSTGTDDATAGVVRRRPKWIVQVDQYGVIHAPFAAARAFLSEYGFGDCRVLVQQNNREQGYGPLLECDDADEDDTTNHAAKNVVIMEVAVNDIAPSMPRIG